MDGTFHQTDGKTDHDASRIESVAPYALTMALPEPTHTAWGRVDRASILLVAVHTQDGRTGVGEALARSAPDAHATVVRDLLAPRLIGEPASAIATHSRAMRCAQSGRAGGILMEAAAAVDIALWDLLGQRAGLPVATLLGGADRACVPAYGASVPWGDDGAADDRLDRMTARGFTHIKIKLAGPAKAAIRRVERMRARAGDALTLSADANWAFSREEALTVGRALDANGFHWFEEPLIPEDEDGYRVLKTKVDTPLAAGESNTTAGQAKALLADGTLSIIQPNVTRTGISEARLTAEVANLWGARYAPHVGMSGIVCEAASLHLAAAAQNTEAVECATSANPFRDRLSDLAPAHARVKDGHVAVPNRPGLGLTIDWDLVAAIAADRP